MCTNIYRDLSWLLPCPADFNRQCRAALESGEVFGQRIRRLANYALNDTQLIRLGKAIAVGLDRSCALAPLKPFCLGLASNSTTEFISDGIIASAARHGLALSCNAVRYGQVLYDSLSLDSAINRA